MKIFLNLVFALIMSFVSGYSVAQEADIQATENLGAKYSTMGTYEGLRADQVKKEKVTAKFQKYDYTPPGIWLSVRFDKKPNEKPVKADHFLFELELSIEQYAKIFESTEKLEQFNVGPHEEVSQGDLYHLNKVDAETDKDTNTRTIKIQTIIGDQGVQTRQYETVITVRDKNIVSVSHVKKLRRRGLFGPGKFETVAEFSSESMTLVEKGLDIREYGWVRKDENIESAAKDASPENLEKIVSSEKGK